MRRIFSHIDSTLPKSVKESLSINFKDTDKVIMSPQKQTT